MKLRRLLTVALAAVFFSHFCALAQQTNEVASELKDLVTQIRATLAPDKKTTEADLAAEIKQFDALLAKHKDEKTDAVATILFSEAMLYLQVLDNPQKAAELVHQMQRDFPDTTRGKNADKILDSIQKQVEAKKIQAGMVDGAGFPDFAEKDLAGEPLSIAKYRGKVVLVDFWATWCAPCVRELPNVIKAYEKHHGEGFEIVGISLDQEEQKVKDFTKEKGMTWQQFFYGKGWGNKLAVMYGIQSIPATFLLNGEGKIIGKDLRGDDLEAALTKALAKK